MKFPNFYWIFIKKNCQIIFSPTQIICKKKLKWEFEAKKAFQNLKFACTIVLILIHLDFFKPFYKIRCFKFCISNGFITKRGTKKILSSCNLLEKFFSCKDQLQNSQQRTIYHCRFDSIQEWFDFLEDALYQVIVYTSYKNPKYTKSTCKLNYSQVHYNVLLFLFNFIITCHPRKQ